MLTSNPVLCPQCHDTFYNTFDENSVKILGMCSHCRREEKELKDLK